MNIIADQPGDAASGSPRGRTSGRRPFHLAVVRTLVSIGALLAVAAGWGCGPDFQPIWRVKDFRVIAIGGDPPSLESGERTTLTLHAHRPRTDGEQPTFRATWTWCPIPVSASRSYECPVSALTSATGNSGTGSSPPFGGDFELGTGRRVDFEYPGSEEDVLTFCRRLKAAVAGGAAPASVGRQVQLLDCKRGYRVPIVARASFRGRTITAKKRIVLHTGGPQKNHNPRFASLEIRPAGNLSREERQRLEWPRTDGWSSLDSQTPTPIFPEMKVDLAARVDRGSVETWRPPPKEGSGREFAEERTESLGFQWFTSRGTLGSGQKLYDPELNSLDDAGRNTLVVSPERDRDAVDDARDNCPFATNDAQTDSNGDGIGDACRVLVWVVVRDGRLGMAIRRISLALVPRPSRR